jgi:hypothetical protein
MGQLVEFNEIFEPLGFARSPNLFDWPYLVSPSGCTVRLSKIFAGAHTECAG